MYTNQHEEHLAHTAPCNSRWDGFDRGDTNDVIDEGSKVIGRMMSGSGYKVQVIEFWYGFDTFFEVSVNGRRVHSTEGRAKAFVVARWWMAGCPA